MDQEIKNLAKNLGAILQQKGLSVSTAESCTGGGVAYAITSISGSSTWFNQAYVTYANQAKHDLVGVSLDLINTYGAVSQEVVEKMAQGAKLNAKADLAVALSGIAGPTGGTPDKPVGTVWMAISYAQDQLWTNKYIFSGDRDQVREQAIKTALEQLCLIAQKISK